MKKLLLFIFLMTISLGQSQNLITNGDFSTGIDGWVGADGYVSSGVYSRTAPGGQQPYEVNLGYPLSITTPVGTGYTLSFQASSTTGRTILAGLGLNGGDYTNVIQTVTLTSTPKRFTLNFNTNFSSASSRIFFDMGNVAGDVTIDNVVLSLTPSNLITNGDFESGDAGWTGATGNLVTTGDDATYYSRTAPGGQQPYEVNLSRPVSLTAAVGTSYQLSFQAWSNTGKTILAGIGLAGDPWTNQVQTVTLTSTPQTFFLDLTTNFSSANSRIIFDMGAAAGDVNIDNVVLSSAAVVSTCNNGVLDGDETGIDCGGSCSACPEVVNIEGKWKVTELGVGPAKGSYGYFSLNVSSGERSCFFDDVYQFNADASFNFLPGTQTYREGWLGSGCGAPVAPFDGSNAATYTNSGSAITVTGTGAFIGLPKAINGAEIDNTAAHPGIVTYQATSVTTTAMTLDIAVAGGAWWRYKLAKVDESLPIISDFPVLEKALTDLPFDLATPTSNSAGAFTYTSSNQAVATISGATVTIVGAGTTTITATQAANGTYNTGSITAQLVVAYPAPAVAATTPTRAAEDVISVFSNAYTDIIGTAFRSFGGATTWTQLNIATNPTNRYTNFDYVGNTFGAGGVNATDMQQLHLDIWTPDCTSFDVYVLDGSDEQKVTLTPTTSEWNSFDIDLSQYTLLTKSSIVELKFVNGGSGTKTIYLDNIYFWKTPAGTLNYYVDADADGYGAGTVTVSATPIAGSVTNNTDCNDSVAAINPGATEILDGIDNDCDSSIDEGFPPATDAPTAPARNAWDVISVYSNAYTTITPTPNYYPIWDAVNQTTQFSNYTPVSDETLKYSNLNFQGIDFNGGKNVSAMTKLHLDVYTRDLSSFKVFLIAGGENAVTLTPTLAGWNSYDLDLATQYADRNLSNAIQLKLERTLWTPGDGNVNSLYVDNIYFYRAATGSTYYVDADGDGYGAGTAVTLEPSTAPTGYSVNSTDCDDTKALVNPGATEIFDTIDNDCDGVIDEGTVLVAPIGGNTQICIGAAGVLPPATALPGYTLVWYANNVSTTKPLTIAPAAVATATKTYYVAQKLGTNGTISARAASTVTVNALPDKPLTLTSLDAKKICKYIDSDTPVLFSATPTGASSYIWTTTINNITEEDITNDGDSALISFKNASTTPGLIGSVKVQIEDAKGCISLPRELKLTTLLPTAPTSLVMTSADNTPHFKGLVSAATELTPAVYGLFGLNSLTAGIKKVGPYMGTETVFTLTAAEASTAASYEWTLNGATQKSGEDGRIITVDFLDVEPGIGSLPIVVKSVGGCGTSTARTLTLARAVPTAPTKLVLTDEAIELSTTVTTKVVTKVGPYTDKPTQLTLTATPFTTQGATATSYAWILPAGVNCETNNEPTFVKVKSTLNTGTTEVPVYLFDNVAAIATASSTITINFDGVASAVTALPIQVFAVNGAGNSIARTLTLTAAAPATPAIVGSDGNGTAAQFGSCLSKTYTATSIPGATYNWTAPGGTITQNGNVIVVNYSATLVPLLGTSTVTCSATNGTGTSGVKSLTVKRIACTSTKLSDSSASAFSAKAYPNPSSSEFTIETSAKGAMSVKVYDMQGRLVEKAQSNRVGSKLATGTYNVIVNQGANTKSVRVIKR
jgi:hypothetical protein